VAQGLFVHILAATRFSNRMIGSKVSVSLFGLNTCTWYQSVVFFECQNYVCGGLCCPGADDILVSFILLHYRVRSFLFCENFYIYADSFVFKVSVMYSSRDLN